MVVSVTDIQSVVGVVEYRLKFLPLIAHGKAELANELAAVSTETMHPSHETLL